MIFFQLKVDLRKEDTEEYAGVLSFFLRALVRLIHELKVNDPLLRND